MEWENKFSSIVKETESNLAKVKNRLNSSRNVTFSNSFGPSSTQFTNAPSSPYNNAVPYAGMSSSMSVAPSPGWVFQGDFSKHPGPSPSPKMPADNTSMLSSHIDQSPAVSLILSDRIEAQARTISNLNGTIKELENERDQFNRKLNDISAEVTSVNHRVAERGVHLATERKVEQWKQEVMSELNTLRNQVHRNQDTGTQPMDNIYHMKRFMKDEFDSIRQDMDHIKSRLDKVEAGMARMERSNRETSHRQDRLETGLNELGTLQRSNTQQRSNEHSLVDSFRNSVHFLEDRLANLETRVSVPACTSSPSLSPRSPKKHRLSSKRKPLHKKDHGQFESDLLSSPNPLSDLDLSDDDDLDKDIDLDLDDDDEDGLSDVDLDLDTEGLSMLDIQDSSMLSSMDKKKHHRIGGSSKKVTSSKSRGHNRLNGDKEDEYEFSDPGMTSLGLLSDLQSGEVSGADTLDHTLSIDEL